MFDDKCIYCLCKFCSRKKCKFEKVGACFMRCTSRAVASPKLVCPEFSHLARVLHFPKPAVQISPEDVLKTISAYDLILLMGDIQNDKKRNKNNRK